MHRVRHHYSYQEHSFDRNEMVKSGTSGSKTRSYQPRDHYRLGIANIKHNHVIVKCESCSSSQGLQVSSGGLPVIGGFEIVHLAMMSRMARRFKC